MPTITKEEAQNLLDRQQAADFLGMSIHTFKKILSRHEIEVIRLGGRPRFREAALVDWLNRQIEPPLNARKKAAS